MKMIKIALYIFLAVNSVQSLETSDTVVAHTSKDPELGSTKKLMRTIEGFHVNNKLLENDYDGEGDVFLGVPYAVPLSRQTRFQKSELIKNYGSRSVSAKRFGKFCPQIGGEEYAEKFATTMGIDCLTLNIYAPNVTDKSRKYPVMAFLHGGALKFGNAVEWMVNGIVNNIVSKQVIWISIHYRVGPLGFFTTFTDEFPANRGIWDQITALKWIQEEISSFGGDPSRVTLVGHSAGACSASSLAQSKAVHPSLFHGIILQSCSAEICFDKIYGRFHQSEDLALKACNVSLKNYDWSMKQVKDIKKCFDRMEDKEINSFDAENFRWNIVIDNVLFHSPPKEAKWRQLPVLIGSTRDEWSLYPQWALRYGKMNLKNYTLDFVKKSIEFWVSKIYGKTNIDMIMSAIWNHYRSFVPLSDGVESIKFMSRVMSDMKYIKAVGQEAVWHVMEGNANVWLWHIELQTDFYSFYPFEDFKPAFHGIDLFLLMQPEHAWQEGKQPGRRSNAINFISNQIAEQFISFATKGEPSVNWRRLEPKRMNYWRINDKFGESAKNWEANDYGGEHYKFWTEEITKLIENKTKNQKILRERKPGSELCNYEKYGKTKFFPFIDLSKQLNSFTHDLQMCPNII